MAADTLKAVGITNSDASPPLATTAGAGAPGMLRNASDYVGMTTGGLASTSSTYKMLRLKSNVYLKTLEITSIADLDSNASPTLALDVGAYYSDSTVDGTSPANQGTSISVNCFLANTAFAQHTAVARKVDALGALDPQKRCQPLWQAVGLSTDPGGFIDVVVAVHTAAATAVAGNIFANATFCE